MDIAILDLILNRAGVSWFAGFYRHSKEVHDLRAGFVERKGCVDWSHKLCQSTKDVIIRMKLD